MSLLNFALSLIRYFLQARSLKAPGAVRAVRQRPQRAAWLQRRARARSPYAGPAREEGFPRGHVSFY